MFLCHAQTNCVLLEGKTAANDTRMSFQSDFADSRVLIMLLYPKRIGGERARLHQIALWTGHDS